MWNQNNRLGTERMRIRSIKNNHCCDIVDLPEWKRYHVDNGNVDHVDGWCCGTKCWCLVVVALMVMKKVMEI